MIFQGQEMLETRAFGFKRPTAVDFSRAEDANIKGIVQMYRDLIALRRNLRQKTRVPRPNLNIDFPRGAYGTCCSTAARTFTIPVSPMVRASTRLPTQEGRTGYPSTPTSVLEPIAS